MPFEFGTPDSNGREKWAKDSPSYLNMRTHTFQQKVVVMPDTCGPCGKRMRFGRTAMKCKDCRALCHPECKDALPLPCIPQNNTPNSKQILVRNSFSLLFFIEYFFLFFF